MYVTMLTFFLTLKNLVLGVWVIASGSTKNVFNSKRKW